MPLNQQGRNVVDIMNKNFCSYHTTSRAEECHEEWWKNGVPIDWPHYIDEGASTWARVLIMEENTMQNWIDIQVQEEQRRDALRAVEHRRMVKAARTTGSPAKRLSDHLQDIVGQWLMVLPRAFRAGRRIFSNY